MAQPSKLPDPGALRSIDIFKNLSPEKLEEIAEQCAWRIYDKGEPVIDYLDESSDIYFVMSGVARANIYSTDGKAVTFSDLEAGHMFGEYAAIDGAPRSVGVEAITRCLVGSMKASTFRDLLNSEPAISSVLMRQMVQKIRALTARVYEFSTLAVNNRIHAELLRLSGKAEVSGKEARIDPAPTHSDLASRTSTHREAVARELSRLSKIGVIERRGRSLIIKDIEQLTDMVHDATGE